jgi:hypothetical protein
VPLFVPPHSQAVRVMSSPKPKTIESAAITRDYSHCDLSATVTIGRELLGHVIDGDRHVIALTPGREYIGTFPNRKSAVLAILMHPKGRATA